MIIPLFIHISQAISLQTLQIYNAKYELFNLNKLFLFLFQYVIK